MTGASAGEGPTALRIAGATIRARLAPGAGSTQAPRDLPNLARYLLDAVTPEPERALKVLDRLTIDVEHGERLVLLGEEGCGKTTLARACARLVALDAGDLRVQGLDVAARANRDAIQVRRLLQVMFDDAEAGLDPRRTVMQSLRDAFEALELAAQPEDFSARAARAMARARLPASVAERRARDLSAGLRARAALARALLADPAVLVIDEPTARLDPLERAALLEALVGVANARLTTAAPPAVIVLSHSPDVARAFARRVGVLYLGSLIELGGVELLNEPAHPYTRGFLAAAPQRSRPASARALIGELPNIAERPHGCPFHPRCPDAIDRCVTERPTLAGAPRLVACHVVNEPAAR